MLDLPSYGYVLLTVVLTYFLLFWQGFMVGQKRKLYKVDYPAMYSDTEPMFNCYQVRKKRFDNLSCLCVMNICKPEFSSVHDFAIINFR